MADVRVALHRIRVKLYPGRLPGQEDGWIARTDNEKTLSIEEVIASAKENGRFSGNADEFAGHVLVFIKEAAHLLCDGFAVSFLLFSVHPHVKGRAFSRPGARGSRRRSIRLRSGSGCSTRCGTGAVYPDSRGRDGGRGGVDQGVS